MDKKCSPGPRPAPGTQWGPLPLFLSKNRRNCQAPQSSYRHSVFALYTPQPRTTNFIFKNFQTLTQYHNNGN